MLNKLQRGQNSSHRVAYFAESDSVDRTFPTSSALRLRSISLLKDFTMLMPFYSTAMLTMESCNVISLRLMRLMAGTNDAHDEAHLMVSEKVSAMFEAGANLMAGGTASSVVDRYREHVAANAKRLSR